MNVRVSSSILFLALGAVAASAQDGDSWMWRQIVPVEGSAPLSRTAGTAVFDPIARRLVIFGGDSDEGLLNDVWAFDLLTSSWSELATTGQKPEPRLGANAVYDPNGHQIRRAATQGTGVAHNVINVNAYELRFVEIELK